jgi:hypothetical protein
MLGRMSAAADPDRPAVFVTHGVALEGRVGVKRYRPPGRLERQASRLLDLLG